MNAFIHVYDYVFVHLEIPKSTYGRIGILKAIRQVRFYYYIYNAYTFISQIVIITHMMCFTSLWIDVIILKQNL